MPLPRLLPFLNHRSTIRITGGLAFMLVFHSLTDAQPLPKKKTILAQMTLANDYFRQQWPDPGKETVTDKVRPSNIWTRAVYYEGLMALCAVDGLDATYRKRSYDYAIDWGQKHQWGLRSGPATRNADDQACGQTYLDLYRIDGYADSGKPERIQATKSAIDAMVQSDKIDDWNWVDALQMAMPVFARLAELPATDPAARTRYYEKMHQMYRHTKTVQGGKGLYNPADGLWWRDKDFVPPYQEPNGKDCYWSRGNGWVVAALVRVLDIMPPGAPHRADYQADYMAMMRALPKLQRPDGFWNVSLHDSTHFGGKETSGTALFTYGMAWGLNHGLLDRKTYQPIVVRAWNAMTTDALHATGFLGYMQGTGKEPKDSQPVTYDRKPNFEDYGLGCFLLAGGEVAKMK